MNKKHLNKKKFIMRRVLISGAGIAGPALAFWLHRYGFEVTVVERAPSVRRGGYRVDLRGRAVDVAARMGLLSEIRRERTALRGSTIMNRKGKSYIELDNPDLFGMRRPGDVELLRGDLASILYEATKQNTTYLFGNSITSIEDREDDALVTFRDGSRETFDYVIGADGVHSTVRKIVFGPEEQFLKPLGYNLSTFTLPNDYELNRWEVTFPSVQKGVNVYSAHETEEAHAFFLFRSNGEAVHYQDVARQKECVFEAFSEEGPDVNHLLSHLDNAKDFYFDSLCQVRMTRLYKGRTVLLGDAGYCPSPSSGQGTSLALVGAYVLAGELAKGNHTRAFASYQQAMQPYIDLNQELALTVIKEMIPSSSFQLRFQTFMLRLLLKLPNRERVIRGFLKKTQDAVNRAADGIQLPDYNDYNLAYLPELV